MPVHLPPLNRRQFLAAAGAATVGWLTLGPSAFADRDSVDPNYFVLLADTHIDKNLDRSAHEINMADMLAETVKRILRLDPKPAAIILNGDAAYSAGFKEDYETLERLLRPISRAGIPIHITMGNHDDRGPFYEVMREHRPQQELVEGRHLSVLQTPHVNLFLLDSLKIVNQTPGRLGEEQRQWLEEALRAHRDRPAILFAHHHYHIWDGTPGRGGLQDTEQLWKMITPMKHVKAYCHGHLHTWWVRETEGIHRVCQPCTAYTFLRPDRTQAFLHAHFRKDRMELEVECLDGEFEWHGERQTLAYRQ